MLQNLDLANLFLLINLILLALASLTLSGKFHLLAMQWLVRPWFLKQFHNQKINFIDCAGGRIKTWEVNGFTWIQAGLSSMPPWQFEQLKDIVAVETFPTKKALLKKHTFVWAWQDKNKGIIRARTFAPDWGIPEDEANGSGAMKLSAKLRSKITVIHGQGSVIYANFAGAGLVEVGGRVAELLV